MFAEILGLGASLIGSAQANSQANAQLAFQQYQFRQQMEMQRANMAMARDAQRRQTEENEYQRQIEQMNRLMAQQERQFQIQQNADYKNQLMAERREQIERQILEDKEAAKQREFQLQQLLQNQELRAEERDFAIQQLNEAKAIAAGERDDDMRRFMEEREMAKIEREFVINEYNDFKMQAQAERDQELAVRNQILGGINDLQFALYNTQQELGQAPQVAQLTQADIDREISRRQGQYESDIDRAADRVASVNEADLIRAGLDASSPGGRRRADITAQIGQEYQNARSRAYDDAMSYITGRTSALDQNVANIMANRGSILQETAGVAGAGLDQLQNIRQLPTATGAYQMAPNIRSAIYNRGISSANNYSAPVAIGSAVYDGINVGPSIAQYRVPATAAYNQAAGVGSAIFNPYNVGMTAPGQYMTNAGQIGNQLLSSSTNMYNSAADRAYQASSGFGSALFDAIGTRPITGYDTNNNPIYGQSLGQRADNWINTQWNSWFGGS